MLLRLGKTALAFSFLLVSAPLAIAQNPLYVPGNLERSAQTRPGVNSGVVPIGAVEQLSTTGAPIIQTKHSTTCNFDPYQEYHEGVSQHRQVGWRQRLLGPDQYVPGCGGGCDSGCGDGCGYGDNCGNFECANAWGRFDVEKRFILAWGHGNAHKPATQFGYGDYHGGLFTTEVLPWVITDGDAEYTRWGLSGMFGYYRTQGNRSARLLSQTSGRTLTVNSADIFSFTVGPTIRTDFYLGGLRLSPSVFGGVAFDWTDISEIRPVAGTSIRTVNQFKYAGFDVGGYVRLMLDFGITKKMNIGVGIDYKATPTNVMVQNDETRKHLGLIVAISHEF